MPDHRPDLLTAALGYSARGWRVFPLVPGEKRPAVTDWETRATTEAHRIRRCWGTGDYGIGIACGPSGLLVLDLDTAKPDTPPLPADLLAEDLVRELYAERFTGLATAAPRTRRASRQARR